MAGTEKQRINMDLDKELWRQVSVEAARWDIEKRELVAQSIQLALDILRKVPKKKMEEVAPWLAGQGDGDKSELLIKAFQLQNEETR